MATLDNQLDSNIYGAGRNTVGGLRPTAKPTISKAALGKVLAIIGFLGLCTIIGVFSYNSANSNALSNTFEAIAAGGSILSGVCVGLGVGLMVDKHCATARELNNMKQADELENERRDEL